MKCETISEVTKFLDIQEQALGTHSPEVATTVSRLAKLYMDKGMLDDAEKLYKRALEIREKAIGPHKSESEECRRSLARIKALRTSTSSNQQIARAAKQQKQLASSDSWCSVSTVGAEVVRDSERLRNTPWSAGDGPSGGNKALDSTTSLDAVTESLKPRDPSRYNDELKEAKLEAELMRQVSGCNSVQLADSLTRLADLFCRTKQYEQMEPILLEALAIRKRNYGNNHILVSNSIKNLARLYYFQGRYREARPLFERALLIRKSLLGPSDPKVADVLDNYAKLLKKMGRLDEANALLRESDAIKSKQSQWKQF